MAGCFGGQQNFASWVGEGDERLWQDLEPTEFQRDCDGEWECGKSFPFRDGVRAAQQQKGTRAVVVVVVAGVARMDDGVKLKHGEPCALLDIKPASNRATWR